MFWLYKGPYVEQEEIYTLRRPRRRHDNSSTPTVHRYDEEIDYTLPSYDEVPAPPAYTKTVIPENNDETIEANSDAETSSNSSSENIPEDSAHIHSATEQVTNENPVATSSSDHVVIHAGTNTVISTTPIDMDDRSNANTTETATSTSRTTEEADHVAIHISVNTINNDSTEERSNN